MITMITVSGRLGHGGLGRDERQRGTAMNVVGGATSDE